VLVEHRGPVAVVTLNRPDHLNALSPDNALPVLEALNELREDGSCRVVVLTGAGRAFCSGMDLVAGLDRQGTARSRGDTSASNAPPRCSWRLCSLTGDAGEGISAAVERRTPTFSNS
jgi:enoyl-CoA hydratase/carnithine racemase